MKRLFILLVLATFIFTSCTTNPAVNKAFAKYSHKEGVTSITVPGWLIGIASNFGDFSGNEQELLDCVDKVKVLVVENEELNSRINLHKEFHKEINKNNEYEELLTVRDEGENVTIFGKMNKDVINEMIVLVGGDDNVMIYLEGEIKPEMLNSAIDLTNSENFLSIKRP